MHLYRRHRRDCKAGHPEESTSGEFEERKKAWKRCDCPIFATASINKRRRRQSTNQWEWEAAKVVANEWEKSGTWTAAPAQPQQPVIAEPSNPRVQIADAVKVFLATREGAKIAGSTLRKYRTFAKQLTGYADQRGYLMIDQFTPADIDMFYAGMKLGLRAKAKRLGTLRSFFRFAVNREWIGKTPVSQDLKPPVGSSKVVNKMPFSDDELERIIKACDRMPTVQWQNSIASGVWTCEDLKDFIWSMIYTGLRISDVALFDMKRLRGREIFLRAKKNGGDVYTVIPEWLKNRLEDRAKRKGRRPFITGTSDRLETVTDMWRRQINRVFELAGEFEEKPTPHRFRHTFARILLEKGVPVSDVADLLGDDEKTVREHYARWIPERQARLSRIVDAAFEERPRPKVVNMPTPR